MRLSGALLGAVLLCGLPGNAAAIGSSVSPTQDIDSIIGDAACRSAADCRTVAVGRKACGGPAAYRAWSIGRTDPVALAAAAEASASAALAAESGRASDCRLVTDPGAVCVFAAGAASAGTTAPGDVAGRCTLRRGGGVGRRAD